MAQINEQVLSQILKDALSKDFATQAEREQYFVKRMEEHRAAKPARKKYVRRLY